MICAKDRGLRLTACLTMVDRGMVSAIHRYRPRAGGPCDAPPRVDTDSIVRPFPGFKAESIA
jgi:hypothetical protein